MDDFCLQSFIDLGMVNQVETPLAFSGTFTHCGRHFNMHFFSGNFLFLAPILMKMLWNFVEAFEIS